eukprot:TRINITY_DN6298_c0_g1_i4.p1 TRINITY_DN6298_c0_g1~~TRINITY_DN6298_c0_g1_i4.p1  ORF type:complete len:250 (-),score=46.70 TRINITY_DN6298_c0_g1_i4:71-820(-)
MAGDELSTKRQRTMPPVSAALSVTEEKTETNDAGVGGSSSMRNSNSTSSRQGNDRGDNSNKTLSISGVIAGSSSGRLVGRTPRVTDSCGLRPGGWQSVPGFEIQGLKVARCKKKLPKTQSWCFVPLIFSALGHVPAHLVREDTSSSEQIEAGQEVWETLFSHWSTWRSQLQVAISKNGKDNFVNEFLPKAAGAKGWSTSLVYGRPRDFGKLPHPNGRQQDRILGMLPADIQNQIFASVITLASGSDGRD